MLLPNITNKQKYILFLLYTFRFLTTYQIQKLLNHKNPKRTQTWLKDLKYKGYIAIVDNLDKKSTFIDKNKPFIYHLASKAKHILKENEECDRNILEKIYKEHKRTETFINHCLVLADVYLFLLSQKEPDEELHFFTESNLVEFEYLPDPLPAAYIAVTTKEKTRRYFLDLFYDYASAGVLRYRFQTYLQYARSGTWEANEHGKPFPTILFICPTQRLKKHISFYAAAVLKKSYEENFHFFVTTKDTILQSNKKDIWEQVNVSED